MSIATRRLGSQRLIGEPFDRPAQVVRWLGAVQAQDFAGALWALALRNREHPQKALIESFDAGEFLRTHVMRPTWHLVAPEDLRWLLALTSPRVHAANTHRYRRLELDEALFRRAHGLFVDALEGGLSLTRQQLADVLETNGIITRGQRLAYIVMQAELSGLLCSGPLRGKQHTYALLEERVPPAPPIGREEALATLTLRYFASHGPATPHDFAWWSGLTVAGAREGIDLAGSQLERESVDGRSYYSGRGGRGAADPIGPIVHLLPNYDELVVAYRDHTPSVDPAAREALRAPTNLPLGVHPVARNGLVVGAWKRTMDGGAAVIAVDLLAELDRPELAALQRAAQSYGVHLGMRAELRRG